MKRFRFRLQALLKYKQYLEQMARLEMARAVADVNACEMEIQRLVQHRMDTALQLEKRVVDGIRSEEFRRYQEFLAVSDQMILQERIQKQRLEKIMEEKRSLLTQRTVEKKALERLREKRVEEYTQDMLKEEQKGLDEVASLKRARELAHEGK